MHSIFCKTKIAKKHEFSTVKVRAKNWKDRCVQSFAKRQKLKKHEFRAVRAKNWKKKCVQSFAKQKQLKNMDLTLLELKTRKTDSFNFLESKKS